jgi:crotonobetainyl-CoA:carnitine CoA-transferase CaiB-like acyl-CoA transferase
MSAAPLAGVVVVELGHSVAAPYAGQILGDLGADVVKIEKADGDDARKWGPPFVDGASTTFQALNRNKRSAVCDLRDIAQREALVRYIVDHADVVIQNLRPGQVDELGLDGGTLISRKPALVYCNMGAFGTLGPLRERPGYDPLMQAFGGIMSVVGEEGRPPVRVGPSIIDMGTAMWAVVGIVSALYRRRERGAGGVVDVSLFETTAAWMTLYAAEYLASGDLPKKTGSGRNGIAPYRAFETADGQLLVTAGNDSLFRRYVEVLGHPEWAQDQRFRDNPSRVRNADLLNAMIETEMQRRPSSAWMAALEAAGVPCGPVQDIKQVLEHEQMRALGLLQAVEGSSVPLVGLPVSFDGKRPGAGRAAPALGESTNQILPGSKERAA